MYNNFGDFMTTTIYLIRHCEALGNKSGTFQGSIDSDITEIGAKQIEFLGKRFENKDIDKVYSSPLLRARKTAQAVADATGLSVVVDNGLTEIHGGDIEGMSYADIYKKYPDIEMIWTYSPQNFAPPNGEPMRLSYERIVKTVFNLVKENAGKKIAIASHGAVSRCLLCKLIYDDIERLNDVTWCDNTSVTKIIFDENMNGKIEYINDTSHLPEEYLPSGSKIASYIQRDLK